MHEYKGHKKINYVQSTWFTTVSTLLVLYSVLFQVHIKDPPPKKKALIRNAVLLTSCKHGQKFQFNCALT